MQKLTQTQLNALAEYLTSARHTELRGKLSEYLTAPADKKEELLSELWELYGDKATARGKR